MVIDASGFSQLRVVAASVLGRWWRWRRWWCSLGRWWRWRRWWWNEGTRVAKALTDDFKVGQEHLVDDVDDAAVERDVGRHLTPTHEEAAKSQPAGARVRGALGSTRRDDGSAGSHRGLRA